MLKGCTLKTHLLDNLFAQIKEYLKSLENKDAPASYYLLPQELKDKIDITLPEKGDWDSLPKWIADYLKYAVKTGTTRFYNQLFSGFSLPSFAADVITSATNTSMYTYEVSPLATLIEKELITAMGRLAGFKEIDGGFVTGGSNANLVALFAARDNLISSIKQKGSYDISPLVAFVSEESHYSFGKAMHLMGLGLENLIKVSTDSDGRISPRELEMAVIAAKDSGKKPFFVGATAGTTVRGAFDPLRSLSEITEKYGLWLHVDGAWGASVLMSNQHKHLLTGLEKADSLAWDAHKMMGMSLICSVILFNAKAVLRKINDIDGTEYLFHENNDTTYDLGHSSLQCGRRVDALKLWLAWKCLGRKGFEDNINHLFSLSRRVAKRLTKLDRYELVYEVCSLNICFRYLPEHLKADDFSAIDQFNSELREKLVKTGKAIINYSVSNNRPFFRLILVNFALSEKDVDQLFIDLENAAEKISSE